MRKGHEQNTVFLSVSTALGNDVLLLDRVQGAEGISQLFGFTLTMRSASNALKASAIIGKPVTVTLATSETHKRYINGIVSRFSYLGTTADFATYTAEIVPSMWLLTLGRDRVIYQNMSTPEIVSAVLTELSVPFEDKLSGTYAKREYCVRYDESAFDFVSRLLEDEGIFYFFTHTNGAHKLVLADNNSEFSVCTNAAKMEVRSETTNRGDVNVLHRFEQNERLVIKSHAVDDYNYLTPSTALFAKVDGKTDHKGLNYEYPGRHQTLSAGQARAKIRVQEHQADSQLYSGESHCPHLLPGTKFEVEGHLREEFNALHVVRSVQHHAEPTQYQNSFEAISPEVPFRPLRATPHPVVLGNHTAKVVGSSGEEIWTDEHGRIKVQFPWDRVGKQDDKSSCWIRVSQMWAGQNWGALYLPRIGQEVLVSYLDGDPDRPLVTGSVYNAEHATPVALPAKSSQSTILSRSTKKGAAGNEMRFEDKKDAEELFLHAQKDMLVEIENDLTTTVIAGNEAHTVKKGNRTVKVDTGNEIHSVKGTRALEITGDETHTNKANFTQKVTGNYELKVTGNLVIDVTGTIMIKSAQTVDIKAGTNLTSKAGANLTNDAGAMLTNKGGAKMSNEAPLIDSKASGMHSVEAGGILTLKGALVKIN